jgi:hypothetical protein
MCGLARDPAERQPTVSAFATEVATSIDAVSTAGPSLFDRLRQMGRRRGVT